MKVTTYTLNADGTIPEFVDNGGYFPDARVGDSPQDWTLIGVCTDDAPGAAMTKAQLTTYVTAFSPVFVNPEDDTETPAADVVAAWWTANVG
jgi:hypothetical protein